MELTKELQVMQNEESWPAQKSLWSKSFEKFSRSFFSIYCPLSVNGKINIPKPPFILISNHSSHLDSALLMVGAGLSFQKTGFIVHKKILQILKMIPLYMSLPFEISKAAKKRTHRE